MQSLMAINIVMQISQILQINARAKIFPLKMMQKPSFDLVIFLLVPGFVNNCPNTALMAFRTEFIN